MEAIGWREAGAMRRSRIRIRPRPRCVELPLTGRARVLARRRCFTQGRNQTMERRCQHRGLGSGLRGRNPSRRVVGPNRPRRRPYSRITPDREGARRRAPSLLHPATKTGRWIADVTIMG
jgi:hypothetical protein